MPDRFLTPHELHQKAISVLEQLERLAVDWRRGRIPAPEEIHVVTARVTELRVCTEHTAQTVQDAGAAALGHLAGARRTVAEATRIVDALADEHPGLLRPAPQARALRPDCGV